MSEDASIITCRKCGACCSGDPGYVRVTETEMKKIARYLEMELDIFVKKYIRPAGSGYSLVELPNGNCIFLGEKGCEIYKVRPLQCTTWPFWRKNLASREAWKECCSTCPGTGQGRHYAFAKIQKLLVKRQ